jgi:hypothetical protein
MFFLAQRLPLHGVVTLNDFARKAAHDDNQGLEGQVAVTLGAISAPRTSEAPAQPRGGLMRLRETSSARHAPPNASRA